MFYVESVTLGNKSWVARMRDSFSRWFEIIGYSRAAAHLAYLGYYEESKQCMMEIKKLKESK